MKPIDSAKLYCDGRHYDAQHTDVYGDLSFYSSQAQRFGEPILELACGTGRLTLPLAKEGYDITGLDISLGMLKTAKEKAEKENLNIPWFHADCRNFHLAKKFNLIFIPFNSFAHIHDRESFEALCSCVKKHLMCNGHFIIDIFNPDLRILIAENPKRHKVAEYKEPNSNEKVLITESNKYDRSTQINHITWFYKIGDSKEYPVELNMRIYYPEELVNKLFYNDFEVVDRFGDWDECIFQSDSPRHIVVCKKRI
ncbi:MAG TPA: class I SAM-dependent methyltransferase [Candidatus Cloacimonetes bacterium]|nr:class I SAM-dependent methyltransferase [Candidatus Cloacimonadota bacterium]HEX37982.1 class I SAM-dependent methyltransferase [Candidatus Cloacimonadota bacterium]